MYSDISNTPVSAIVDSRVNGVLITLSTVKQKGLLGQIDLLHKVTINQANAGQKFDTFGILKGGISYQMMSVHGRALTITLPCHVAPVGSDLIGSNEQGPLIKGIDGIVNLELSRPDSRRATCMQMPDGEVVGLPANAQGMTVFPEIGQESQWAVLSHPMEISELCEFLMSRERQRQQREGSAAAATAMMQAEQERLACQARQLRLASTAHTGALDFGWSVQPQSQYGVQPGGTYSSVQMPHGVAQSAMVAHNRLQSASSPCFDYNWNSRREESVGVEDSEIPIQMLAARGGVHGATGGIPVERVHDKLHRDAASNFRTFGPKSDGGARVIVDGKDVGGKLTKADFVNKHDCSACRMTKTTAPWVRQKAAGFTADGNTQMVLERTIICEEYYARQSGVCA